MSANGNKGPVHVVRLGNISATLWDNTSKSSTWYATDISRNYQEQGEWRKSSSFRPSDLPVVQAVAKAALDWIMAQHHDTDGEQASS